MRDSTAKAREALLIDLETGTLLQAPPSPLVSRRYIETHPFAEIVGDHVVVGPHAVRVAAGYGGTDYASYRIDSENGGTLRLTRES